MTEFKFNIKSMKVQERTSKKTESSEGGEVHIYISGTTEEGFDYSLKIPKAVAEEALRSKVADAMAAKWPKLVERIDEHFKSAEEHIDTAKDEAVDALAIIREELGVPEK